MTAQRAAAPGGQTVVRGPSPPGDVFAHEAMLYRSQQELLDGTVGVFAQGLATAEPVLVAAPGHTLGRLSRAVPSLVNRVKLLDLGEAGRNPGRILPMVLLAFAAANAGRRVRIVVEPIWPGRT